MTAGQPWAFTVPDGVFSQTNVGVYGYGLRAEGCVPAKTNPRCRLPPLRDHSTDCVFHFARKHPICYIPYHIIFHDMTHVVP